MGLWSLNHDVSLGLSHTPNFPIIHPPTFRGIYQCKGTPTCPSTAYQTDETLCMYIIWMWDAVYGALKPQPWLYNITRTQPYPNFPIIHPHLQRHISVRAHPHVHPQHIKVLKHFAYISYWCGMQSTGLWSLNHDFATSLGLSHTPISQKSTPTFRGISA